VCQQIDAYVLAPHRLQQMRLEGRVDDDPDFACRYADAYRVFLAQQFHASVPTIIFFQHLGLLPDRLPRRTWYREEFRPLEEKWYDMRLRPEDAWLMRACDQDRVPQHVVASWLQLPQELLVDWLPSEDGTISLACLCSIVIPVVAHLILFNVRDRGEETVPWSEIATILRWHGIVWATWMRFLATSLSETSIIGSPWYTTSLTQYQITRRMLNDFLKRSSLQQVGMSDSCLATSLRLPYELVIHWCDQGLFGRCVCVRDEGQRQWYVPSAQVRQFQQDYILGREVVQEWKIGDQGLRNLIGNGLLHLHWRGRSISWRYWIFSRADLLALTAQGVVQRRASSWCPLTRLGEQAEHRN
jgi:hypothetical protein